jgi:uncharacterized membrane protein
MQLTPEERKKIYEEEKARLEQEDMERQKRNAGGTPGLEPNVASFLCYLGFWVTGIIFLVLEQKNRSIRFHAAQSIVIFGILMIASGFFNLVPVAGQFLSAATGLLIFILWIVLMVKAYRGEMYRLPVAAELADALINIAGPSQRTGSGTNVGSPPSTGSSNDPASQSRQISAYSRDQKTNPLPTAGQVAGSSLAIAFFIAVFIFLNFFNEYIAYYEYIAGSWVRHPLLTSAFNSWLPIVDTAIILAIICHIFLMATGRKLVREAVLVFLDLFELIALTSLLSIFPFNFESVPVPEGLLAVSLGVSLGIVIFIIFIIFLVRLIKLIVSIVKFGAESSAALGKNH